MADPPGPGAELVELSRRLRDICASRNSGVLSPSDLIERMIGQRASLAELDRRYEEALRRLGRGDYEGAIRDLLAIVDDLEALPDNALVFDQWTRALLRLARTEESVGQTAEAAVTLRRLVRTAPGVQASPGEYPPTFIEELDEVRKQVQKLLRRKLVISSNREGVKAVVDGREYGPIGQAPLSLVLAEGRYRVSGAMGEVRLPAFDVDLTSDRFVALDFTVPGSFRPNAGPGLAPPRDQRAKVLMGAAEWLRLDRLVATSMVVSGESAFLVGSAYDVKRGALLREGWVRLAPGKTASRDTLAELASFLLPRGARAE